MARNVEIKARVTDPDEIRRKAAILAGAAITVMEQEDTYFTCSRGRLKLREIPERPGELIYYVRPDKADPSESSYERAEVADTQALKRALAAALGVRGVVRKSRTLYLVGRTRIHLDRVEGLGLFVELEVVLDDGDGVEEGVREALDLVVRLGIPEGDLLEGSYIDFLDGRPTGCS
jgi:predicted adenylyl cyclase CyaB